MKCDACPTELPDNATSCPKCGLRGTPTKCYMCDAMYLHPLNARAGVGKCGDCFWRQVQWEKDFLAAGHAHNWGKS